jgi:hypothetical protein
MYHAWPDRHRQTQDLVLERAQSVRLGVEGEAGRRLQRGHDRAQLGLAAHRAVVAQRRARLDAGHGRERGWAASRRRRQIEHRQLLRAVGGRGTESGRGQRLLFLCLLSSVARRLR